VVCDSVYATISDPLRVVFNIAVSNSTIVLRGPHAKIGGRSTPESSANALVSIWQIIRSQAAFCVELGQKLPPVLRRR
jgi:hypothetical protein